MCDRHSSRVCERHEATSRQRDIGGRGASEAALTRRTVLAGSAAVALGLSGCLGSDGDDGGDVPEPISLTQDDQCEVCGMVIPNHPGPNAQIFYADQTPTGHPNPAHFCSTWEAFQYDFERQNEGWNRDVFYVTDYSSVDYELTTDAGDTLISTHVEADAFVDAAGVTFVAGSEVKGAMGRDLIGFSDQADAEDFQSEYGGTVVAFEDVTESTIAELAST
ncbi:nitrous oxide reductase accessory protein NosL [Salinibaculum salinum]|uniref:nitrous oxide reductase accessory protein NosL n=1 Tax=Salinibaculum salinum TaxID=3131996 RepID=UPI0030ED1A85